MCFKLLPIIAAQPENLQDPATYLKIRIQPLPNPNKQPKTQQTQSADRSSRNDQRWCERVVGGGGSLVEEGREYGLVAEREEEKNRSMVGEGKMVVWRRQPEYYSSSAKP